MQKSPDAFRTISEVAADLEVPQHVLRFWETRFSTIRPLKRGGGRRYYRPDDVELLKGIRQLLYGQGYTIKGVQRILRQDGLRFVQAIGRGEQGLVPAPLAEDDEDGAGFDETVDQEFEAASPAFPRLTADETPMQAESDEPVRSNAPSFSVEDIERLRAALDELRECQRILGTLQGE